MKKEDISEGNQEVVDKESERNEEQEVHEEDKGEGSVSQPIIERNEPE